MAAIAKFGTPEIVNTDQGSQFSASEFANTVPTVAWQGAKRSMDGRRGA